MIPSRKHAAVLIAALAGAAVAAFYLRAQLQSQLPAPQPASPLASTMNRTLVVLDPAHGGPDPGATLPDRVLEKDVVQAFAARLRTALATAGFNVVTTRDADLTDPLTTDQRADIANRTHALACIVLHATATGSGIHVYTSTLLPTSPEPGYFPAFVPTPWDSAQAEYVDQSLQLAGGLGSALTASNFPVVSGRAPVRPLDSLLCPSAAVELAPLLAANGATTPVTDADYQQRVVDTLAKALVVWRSQADAAAAADAQAAAQSRAIAAANAAGVAATGPQSHARSEPANAPAAATHSSSPVTPVPPLASGAPQ